MSTDDSPAPLRVILADSQPLVLAGLQALLEGEGDIRVLASVGDGMQLVETVRQHADHADVVVMDFDLPVADGRACLEYIRWQRWPVRVVVLTARDDGEVIRQALEYGAEGLVFKSAPLEQVLAVLRQVAAGQMVFPSEARRWLTPRPSPLERLSEREASVLALAAEGLTNARIADQLVVSENTVKFHLKNIYEKLGASNRTEASALYHRYLRSGARAMTYLSE